MFNNRKILTDLPSPISQDCQKIRKWNKQHMISYLTLVFILIIYFLAEYHIQAMKMLIMTKMIWSHYYKIDGVISFPLVVQLVYNQWVKMNGERFVSDVHQMAISYCFLDLRLAQMKRDASLKYLGRTKIVYSIFSIVIVMVIIKQRKDYFEKCKE